MCVLGLLLFLCSVEPVPGAARWLVGDEGATSLTFVWKRFERPDLSWAPITMATELQGGSQSPMQRKGADPDCPGERPGPADLVVMAGEQTYVFRSSG